MKENKHNAGMTFKILLIEFILSSLGILFGYTYSVYQENKKWDLLIFPGIKIEGVDIGGKSKEESISIIQTKFIDPMLKKKNSVQALDKTFDIENSKIIDSYDINSAVSEALSFDKKMGIFHKHSLIKTGVEKQYSVDIKYNKNTINNLTQSIEKEINKNPINANISTESTGGLIINQGKEGLKVKTQEFENEIKETMHNSSGHNSYITVPIEVIKPTITADKLAAINSRISSFNTSFAASSAERARNIELAASFINGKILMPGETFSFNDSVGERTGERGFLEAPVIVDHKVESGFGGGICQVSSTLYNAILLAGMKASERTHHTLPSSYVKLGMDATVDWNNIDFKFENTFNYPIYIEMSTINRILNVNIYSNSYMLRKKYTLTNNIYETVNSNTKIVNDSNLALGQNTVIQNSYKGFKVKVIRNTYEDGKVVSSEVISNDYYTPVNGVIKIGSKGN
jgi:vancomycin resistance protein YoaR